MNAFKTQKIRNKYHMHWQEEYILGYVDEQGSTNTTSILQNAKQIMSLATTHKYLTNLLSRGLLKQRRNPQDKRITIITLSKQAVDFIKELSHAN